MENYDDAERCEECGKVLTDEEEKFNNGLCDICQIYVEDMQGIIADIEHAFLLLKYHDHEDCFIELCKQVERTMQNSNKKIR